MRTEYQCYREQMRTECSPFPLFLFRGFLRSLLCCLLPLFESNTASTATIAKLIFLWLLPIAGGNVCSILSPFQYTRFGMHEHADTANSVLKLTQFERSNCHETLLFFWMISAPWYPCMDEKDYLNNTDSHTQWGTLSQCFVLAHHWVTHCFVLAHHWVTRCFVLACHLVTHCT